MKDVGLKRRMMKVQAAKFRLDMSRVSRMRRDAVILHPMPINSAVNEITPEVDNDPRCAMFRQARGGMFSRMALICEQLGVNIL
jgi:aspartate carbamoyltransferase catalytic subunit